MQVKIFRFDTKKDVLAYVKPYFFDDLSFKTLADLLMAVKQTDPYFDFSQTNYVKINGAVASINTDFQDILSFFENELEIYPLCEKRVVKDLNIDDSDFWGKFEPFAKFCQNEDKAFYSSLKPYFYADFIKDYEPNFIGFSAIIFAFYLSKKYPSKMAEILTLINDKKFGAHIGVDPSKFIFKSQDLEHNLANKALLWVRENLTKPTVKIPNLAQNNPLPKLNLKHDFSEFKIAFYGKNSQILKNFKAKIIDLAHKNTHCGFEFLGLNDELAVKLASEILFQAFDSGADFLCVEDEKEFYMLDTLSNKCEEISKRKIGDFYVLRMSELISLANGDRSQSLKEHRLKVTL